MVKGLGIHNVCAASVGPHLREGATLRILLIEDDAETATYVVAGLREEGHLVTNCNNGRNGLLLAASGDFELLIVDRMLPGLDGLAIVKTLRASRIETPVLFLTTMSGVDDRVIGLNAGADDYLVKPFAFSELAARVNALGRRPRGTVVETHLKVADLEIDLLKHVVRRAGRLISLQPREFRLLEYLMRHAGEVVTRTMLLENVWDYHFDPRTNIVESHLSRLRTKVDKAFAAELIHTVRGKGYCLRDPG
jgi:two-component system OmpR family response regulator